MRPVMFVYVLLIILAFTSAMVWWSLSGEEYSAPASSSLGSQAIVETRSPDKNVQVNGTGPQPVVPAQRGPDAMIPIRRIMQSAATLGFGRFIDEAASGRDPRASFEAAQLAATCAQIDELVSGRFRYLQEKVIPEAGRKILLEELQQQQDIQRKCQTVSSAQIRLRSELLQQAAVGAVFGAAKQLYMAKAVEGEQPDEPWLFDALVRDANHGDLTAVAILACDHIGQRLSDANRSTYYQTLTWAANSGAGERYSKIAQAKLSRCPTIPYSVGADGEALRSAILNVKSQADRGEVPY